MSKPIISIVGRPNVGKSTLFNAISDKKIAIVKDTPGITRDRLYADSSWNGISFTLIDTGGIELNTKDEIYSLMKEQTDIAIEIADVIIFVVDGKIGLTDNDYKIADILRKSQKKIVLAVNKIDNQSLINDSYEFYNLALGDIYPISASNKKGIGDLLDIVISDFSARNLEDKDDDKTRISIIGRPNAGKSSLINKLINDNRLLVSDIPGTTRDSVDTYIKYNNEEYIFTDTAGLRRKNKIKDELEKYCIVRTVAAVERSDIAILLIDASCGITEQDAKIAGIASERGKGIIIAVNKWDLIEKNNNSVKEFEKNIRATLSFLNYADIVFISALTGQRLNKLYEKIYIVKNSQNLRIKTGVLNEIIIEAIMLQPPPTDKGKRLKVLYASQVSVKPPTFVLFVNDKKLMHFSYKRYLENKIRETFGFIGTPIHFIIRQRKGDE